MTFGDFVTAAQAIAWVQLDAANNPLSAQDQAIVTSLVTPASEWLRSYLGGRFIFQQDYEELRDGLGPASNRFVFANRPVTAVSLVVIDNVTIPAVPPITPAAPGMIAPTFSTSTFGYVFTPTELTVRGYWVPLKKDCVQIQYTAGYLPVNVPPDLTQACLDIINAEFLRRKRQGISVDTGQGIGSMTYVQTDLPDLTKWALERYIQRVPVSAYSRVLAPTATDPGIVLGVLW